MSVHDMLMVELLSFVGALRDLELLKVIRVSQMPISDLQSVLEIDLFPIHLKLVQ